MYLAEFPRTALATLPTALQPAPRFSEALGGEVNIWIKRDDNSGLAMGGNKARKLEFLMADALQKGCDTVITTGGPQSNHCRITAGAAAKLGLECHLVFGSGEFADLQGNLLLDELLGAHLHWLEPAEDSDIGQEMARLAEELAAKGRHPYIIPLGGSTALGALGYLYAVREVLQQADSQGLNFAAFLHASGSGGTQAGLLAGVQLHHLSTEVVGVSVSRTKEALEPVVSALTEATLRLFSVSMPKEERVEVLDQFVGAGYGVPTEASREALQLLARTEGLIIDPVYTAKAVAGLIHEVRRGRWPRGSNVLFWHTGGSPALFADQIFWGGKSI